MKTMEMAIRGMTCDSCALHVQKALQEVTGVVHAEVPDWKSGRAVVQVEAPLHPAALRESVRRAGYAAELPREPTDSPDTSPETPPDSPAGKRTDADAQAAGSPPAASPRPETVAPRSTRGPNGSTAERALRPDLMVIGACGADSPLVELPAGGRSQASAQAKSSPMASGPGPTFRHSMALRLPGSQRP